MLVDPISIWSFASRSAEQLPNHRSLPPCLPKPSTLPCLYLKLLSILSQPHLPQIPHLSLHRKCRLSLNEYSELIASSASPAPYFSSQEVEYDDTMSSLGSFYTTAQPTYVRQPVGTIIFPRCGVYASPQSSTITSTPTQSLIHFRLRTSCQTNCGKNYKGVLT